MFNTNLSISSGTTTSNTIVIKGVVGWIENRTGQSITITTDSGSTVKTIANGNVDYVGRSYPFAFKAVAASAVSGDKQVTIYYEKT